MSQSKQSVSLPPLRGAALVIGSISVSLATFMNVLDTSIANVSLPAIAGDLGVSPNQGTWVITSFAVANAISIPLTGWLAQRFGQVRLFLSAVVLFVLASLLCGLAQSMEMLILARILQGLVAGPMIPMSQSLLLSSFPAGKAGVALAAWGMTALVAPVLGPILGGWISDNFSWPWIFFINVPLGLLAAYSSWLIYRDRETPTRKLPIDKVGLVLMVIWISAVQLMLDKGREEDWFQSPEIVAFGLIALVGLVLFLIWELNEKHPIVDLSLFRQRQFTVCVLLLSLGYCTFFGNMVVLPLWLQTQIGYTATTAGLALAPVGILAFVITPFVGRNIHRVDARAVASFGFLVFALVIYLRSLFTSAVDFDTVLVPAYLQGIAMATFFTPLTLLMLSTLKPEQIPSASGLSNFVRILLGGFGSSIATTLWDSRTAQHHAQLMEQASAFNPRFSQAIDQAVESGLSTEQAYALFEKGLNLQASTLGINDVFWASSALLFCLAITIWLAKPMPRHPASAGVDVAH